MKIFSRLRAMRLLVAFVAVAWAPSFRTPLTCAELIPSERLGPWVPGVTVGVPRGIPRERTNLIDITKAPYRADKTGLTDARPALIAAIRNARSNDVVYLPPGRYRIDAQVHQDPYERCKSFYTIRGAGTNTIIDWRAPWGSVFALGQTGGALAQGLMLPSHRIVAGLSKGSSNLVVNGRFNWTEVGPMIRISQRNDSDVFSVSGYEYLANQLVMVMGVNGSNVSIWPPLCSTFKTNLAAAYGHDRVWMARFVGVEDLVINATNSWAANAPLNLEAAYGCWFKNVDVLWAANYAITMQSSVQCEIRGCMAYGSKHRGPDDWSNHAGLLMQMCSSCLIEDNIMYKFFPGIEVNGGCSGNAFAYNFLEDNNVMGIMGVSLDSNHSPHNTHNLYEGNVASKFQCDGYFGGASDDTVFRNWFHGTCPGTSQNAQCINLNRFSYRYSVAGNVLGSSNLVFLYDNGKGGYGYDQRLIYSLGLPNIGNGGFNGKLGPPWASPVRDGGPVLMTQIGRRVTASSNVFSADMVGHGLLTDDSVKQDITSYIDARTIEVTGSFTRRNEHFKIGPGPGGYQELDTNVCATLIRVGNFNYATGTVPPSESLGTNTLPNSLLYSSVPAWWPATKPWPPIGPDRNPMVTPIPAQDRFPDRSEAAPERR